MDNKPSVVIVKNPRGYTASIRFNDSSRDLDIGDRNKWALYERIEYSLRKAGVC